MDPAYRATDVLIVGGREVDGRTIPARRYRALVAELTMDVGGAPTTGQALIIQRAAGLAVQVEALEARIAAGDTSVDAQDQVRLTIALIRALGALGLSGGHRAAKTVPTTIDGHARAIYEAEDAEHE